MMQCVQSPELDGSGFGGVGAPFTPADIVANMHSMNTSHGCFVIMPSGSPFGVGGNIAPWSMTGNNPVLPVLQANPITRAYPTGYPT